MASRLPSGATARAWPLQIEKIRCKNQNGAVLTANGEKDMETHELVIDMAHDVRTAIW